MISIGFFKSVNLDKSNVKSYEIITEETKKSVASGVIRGGVGAVLLGPVGLLAGALSAKNKGDFLISIEFHDGKKSLIDVDEKIYKSIVSKCF